MIEKEYFLKNNFLDLSLSKRFFFIRDFSAMVEVTENLLPEKIQLGLKTKEEISNHYLTAGKLWEDLFKVDKFRETLTLIDGDKSKHTEEIHQNLRNIRIGGIILRDANRLFSEKHLNSEPFYWFIKKLGLFNDNYENQVGDTPALDVVNALKEYSSFLDLGEFIPCSPESLMEYLVKERDLIRAYLDEKMLTKDNMHDLRKTNRRFLNYFLLRVLDNTNNSSFEIYVYLRKINTYLGDCLDASVPSDSTNSSENLINIPQDAVNLINTFQNRVILNN